tara:strand:- start:189 stop:389 length:201 start_codon:yes stop_codon:yes gene_type:complete
MDNKDLPKIETVTKETWRNTRTGQVYQDEAEARFDLTAKEGEIVKDVTIEVTNKGLSLLKKILGQK